MPRRIHVTPGKLTRSMAGFSAAVAFLVLLFGVALILGTESSSSDDGLQMAKMAFLVIWIAVSLGIIVFNLRVFAKPKDAADVSLFQLEEDAGDERPTAPGAAFDERLRKLEALRTDGLITEEEYRRKRAELLQEKW